MRVRDLNGRNVVIWGTGREGRAAAAFLRKGLPSVSLTFIDESDGPGTLDSFPVCRTLDAITAALDKAEVLIKSPGVSLYHLLVQKLKAKDTPVTSLLSLWLAEPRSATVIGITGTKGKSTTAALLTHTLNALGQPAVLAGNIGVPVTEAPADNAAFIVTEVSSYQAADMEGEFALGVLTSLFPEHLNWHKSLEAYYRDKTNLLRHSRILVVNADALPALQSLELAPVKPLLFNDASGFHAKDGTIYEGTKAVGAPANRHLARPYNLSNVNAVLTVLKQLGFDATEALSKMEDFQGLPHRQQELGEKDGILYVDDSISTTPQSAIAALESYVGKPVTLIAGGYDRGIDYRPLTDYITAKNVNAIVCMGPSGDRIFDLLNTAGYANILKAATMEDAVTLARQRTPKDGVILLSPAAPSYGLFRDFEERGKCFATESGFGAQQNARK